MNESFTKNQSYAEFLKYILPSILSMVFVSFYTTIDGLFISRFVGSNALAAINIVIPLTCVSYGVSVMLATGAGAIVSIKLGKGDKEGADRFFSFILAVVCALSLLIAILGLIFLEQLLRFSGSTDVLMQYTMPYGFWTIIMVPAVMLKLFLEHFARVDGNPKLAMIMSTSGLIFNIVFDFIFIVPMGMGVKGAAIGTGLAILLSGLIGIFYFVGKKSFLSLRKPKMDLKGLFLSCYNGSSEMLTELSTGVTTLFFNLQLLKYCGENGVAAMSVITYLFYFFISVYFGIAVGSQPLISYSYGAKQSWRIKQVLHYSFATILWSSVVVFLVSFIFSKSIIQIFTTDPQVVPIALNGLKLFSIGFLLIGINVFASGYFTAIGKGSISALISISRSLVCIVFFLYTLTRLWGLDGVWLAVPAAEATTLVLSLLFLKIKTNHFSFKNEKMLVDNN